MLHNFILQEKYDDNKKKSTTQKSTTPREPEAAPRTICPNWYPGGGTNQWGERLDSNF